MKKIMNKVRNIFRIFRKPNDEEYGISEEEGLERLEYLLNEDMETDMEMQFKDGWASKSLIEAISADTYSEKLLKLCQQTEVYRLESLLTKE